MFTFFLNTTSNMSYVTNLSQTELHYLIRWNSSLEMIDHLIENEPNLINCVDDYGDSPLHLSFYFNRKDIFALLLSKEANIHLKNNSFLCPYLLAQSNETLWRLIKPYTQATQRWKRIFAYFQCIVILLQLYKTSRERVWMPGGVGFKACEKNFYNNIYN